MAGSINGKRKSSSRIRNQKSLEVGESDVFDAAEDKENNDGDAHGMNQRAKKPRRSSIKKSNSDCGDDEDRQDVPPTGASSVDEDDNTPTKPAIVGESENNDDEEYESDDVDLEDGSNDDEPDGEVETAEEGEEEAPVDDHEDPEVDAEAPSCSSRNARGYKERSHLSEAGIIKQIYVENFMCHRKLKVDLNRNVNFIHGQNGSGKSAILAAIQICLGANARRTHRARNLKDLVRKDAASNAPTSAKVRVTLLNQESDGYKYDVYGDTITVERVISLSGGYNGYRLLDNRMKEQSRLKKDLDDMLDTLNIQVENPVAVLDQEEAKKFLMGKAEDKYNFFMKATELERVDRSYASSIDTVHEMMNSNERIKEGLKQKMDQVDVLKKKYEEHLEIDRLEDKLQQMTVKYAWSYYHSVNAEYGKCLESMKAFQEKAASKEQELSQAEESLGNPNVEEGEKQELMNELLAEAKKQSDLKRELEEKLHQAQVPFKATERKVQALKREQAGANKRLAAARQCLQKARDQIMEQACSAQSEEAQRTALLKQTEEALASARDQVNSLKQAVSSALRSYEELEPHVQDAKSKTKAVFNQLNGVRSTIKELESSTGESLAIWGRNVAKVCKLIEAANHARKFQGPVIGPIGSYLKINPGKEVYASIAELAINSSSLDRFIVTNDNDRRIFLEIRKQAGCMSDCGVFQVKASPRYSVPSPPTVDGIETVASVIKIENDLVFNCLVDNARIDQNALARDKKFSEDNLLEQNGQDFRIRDPNITAVYCLPRGDQWTVKNCSLAMFSNEKKLRQTIGVDKSAALEATKREESNLQDEHVALRNEEAKLEAEHTKYQREWNSAKRAMQKNDATISDLSTKIDEIKTEIETSANVTIDTSEYEEDVRQAEETLEELKESEEKLNQQLEEALPNIDDLKSQVDDCSMRNLKVVEDMEAAEKALTQLLESHSQQKDSLEKKRQKVEKYREIIKKYQEKVDESSAETEKAILKARKLAFRLQLRSTISQDDGNNEELQDSVSRDPTDDELEAIQPIENEREPQYYEVRVTKLKKKLDSERQKRKLSKEDAAVAYEKYVRAKNDITQKTKQVMDVQAQIETLSNDLNDRKRRWKQFRNHLSKTINMKFSEMLSINEYGGDLTFSHGDKTLDLGVKKSSSQSQGVSKDVKSLSGGERSYTTMCLLVALGETLETPFRILDEFDVFLDTEARKLTIKALIHVAKRMEHRQFIFITPQDLTSIQPDPKLKILKLHPPQRYDNAGGPSQQTLQFSQV